MKNFLIMAFISLGIGFSISKIFFSFEKTSSLKNQENKQSDSLIKKMVLKESKSQQLAPEKKDKKKEITETILKSLGSLENNSLERDTASDRIDEFIETHPQEFFSAIKDLFGNGDLDGDPILKGSLMVKAAFIKGKEVEVSEMALSAIFSENIPKEKDAKELVTDEEINKEYSDDPKILGIAQYYDAFLATTINDEDLIFNKSLEIIEKNPNIKVQRLVAKKYLDTFPNNGPVFWELLKNKNIKLIPQGGKITIKGIIYQ